MGERLEPGSYLVPGQSLWSSNGRFSLDYQDNGDLALHKYSRDGSRRCLRVLTDGKGKAPGRCEMQVDANLVVYSDGGDAIWSTRTHRDTDYSHLILQDDGNAVIYRPDGGVVWASNTVSPAPAAGGVPTGGVLRPGEVLTAGQSLASVGGRCVLVYQADGNLVLYRNRADGHRSYLWDNDRAGSPADTLSMQPDGNLVAYDADLRPMWDSGTWNDEDGCYLVVQDDGNLALYRPSGGVAWATDTPRIILRREFNDELHGFVEVDLRPDGAVTFRGLVRNHRMEPISYRVRLVVRSVSSSGRLTALPLEHSGSVEGDLDPTWDPRDVWDGTFHNQQVAAQYFDLERWYPELVVFEQVRGHVTGPLLGFLDDAVRFAVGSTIGFIGGAVIFVAVEVGSVLMSGNLMPGARIISGYLWLAGPNNTLFALAAEGMAALGTKTRTMGEEEHARLTAVFGNTLPSRHQIVFTDGLGADDRPFVFPRFDGAITVNVGARYSDESFVATCTGVHEMTHVWQLHNAPNRLAWLADALISQACHQFDPSVYDPGEGVRSWSDYNLEQQATIVEIWFGRRDRNVPHPYDHLIDGNIRLGKVD